MSVRLGKEIRSRRRQGDHRNVQICPMAMLRGKEDLHVAGLQGVAMPYHPDTRAKGIDLGNSFIRRPCSTKHLTLHQTRYEKSSSCFSIWFLILQSFMSVTHHTLNESCRTQQNANNHQKGERTSTTWS